MHIVILCSRLDAPGGIERAVVNTANLFQDRGYDTTLLVLDQTDASFYPVHRDVRIVQEKLNFGITENGNVLTRKVQFYVDVRKLKTILQRLNADIVIGTEYPLTIAAHLAGRRRHTRIFSWEHHHFHWLQKSGFWNWLFRRVYPKLTAVVCLNDTEKNLYEKAGCRAVVIPNFVNRLEKAALNNKTILSIGWLIERKGVGLIPEIAKRVFETYPDWQWKIIGTGEEKDSLEKAINQSGLSRNIIVQSPASASLENEYKAASLFVMTSRFECFPMVLLEAMSHGVPCIAFDCPTGPGFIINHNADGLLVEQENVEAMADAMIDLIQNIEKRKAFGEAGFQNVTRFSPDKIFALWKNQVLNPVVNDGRVK